MSEPSFSIDVKPSDKATSKFENEVIKDTYEWWVENVLSVFWSHDKFSLKPAKSIEYGYVDVPYPVHVLTNFTAMMSVLDHGLLKNKELPGDLEQRLKRVGAAYALHDYNKLLDSKVSMEDIDDELPEVIDELGKAKEDSVFENFPYDMDTIKTLILSTEKGTTELELRYDVSMPDLKFEINLMKICDSDFGGIFEPETTLEDIVSYTQSAWQRLWGEGTDINYVKLSPSMMHSTRSAVQITTSTYLGHSDEHTLVANGDDGIVFFGPQLRDEFDRISSLFKQYIHTLLQPSEEIEPTDRKIIMSTFRVIPPKKQHLKEFITNESKIDDLFNFSSSKSGQKKTEYDGFQKAKEEFNSKFSDDIVSIAVDEDGDARLDINKENLMDEKTQAFINTAGIFRIYQLMLSDFDQLEKETREEVREYRDKKFFKEVKDEFADVYSPLFYYNEHKSSVLCFLLAKDALEEERFFDSFTIEDEFERLIKMIEEIESPISLDFEEILEKLIMIPENEEVERLEFDSVPRKKEMCLVTGKPAKEKAVQDYIQGVKTQTFTNRAPIVLGGGTGRVSEEVMLESVLRKKAMDIGVKNSSLVYAKPPGISPNISIGAILADVLGKDGIDGERTGQLEVSSLECSVKNDSAMYTTKQKASSDKDILAQVYSCLKFAKQTKLQVFLRMTNELLNPNSDFIFTTTMPSPVVQEMGYDQVKLSELDEIIDEMNKFSGLGEGGFREGLEDGVTSFINDPLSLFTLAEVSDKGGIRSNGENAYKILENRGVDMDEMKEVAEAAYSVQNVAGDSRTDRTWLFTEPIDEVINVELQSGENQKDFEDLVPAIAGHIQQRAKNREEAGNIPPAELEKASLELAKKMVWFINEYWDGNIPQDERMRNATNAFQFLFAHLCYNEGEWNL